MRRAPNEVHLPVIGLAILALSFLVSCGEKKQPEPAKTAPAPPRIVIQDKSQNEKGGNYSLDITYPETGIALLDSLVSTFVHGGINQFKEAIGTDTPSHNWKNQLVMKYSAVITGGRFVSFGFDTYVFTGGAHGMTFIKTLNYDLAVGRLVMLDDIFQGQYLDTLSALTYQMLKDSLGKDAVEEMLRAGTSPKPESFQRFQIIPSGLLIHFEPYAVAPGAWGARQVTIPHTRLVNILKVK